MIVREAEEIRAIDAALRRAGKSWEELRDTSREIVLFGSRACGCARPDSDWDLLCVGVGQRHKSAGIDLLWVTPESVQADAWRESELAGHIGEHGRWLHGQPGWQPVIVPGPSRATQRKSRRIEQVHNSLRQTWHRLAPPYRAKYGVRLRRDLQRYQLLWQGQAVGPSAWLDASWLDIDEPAHALKELFHMVQLSAPLLPAIIPWCTGRHP